MLKTCFTVLIVFLVSVSYASGYETLNTVFIDGEASMVMDGNLDDWEPYKLPGIPVTHPIEKTRITAEVVSTHGNEDCAFSFKCFADQNFVYFALIVHDDEVIIGQNDFGYGFLEDSNTLYFDGDCIAIEKPYFDANDGQLKVIGNPPNGVRHIEGDTPYLLRVIPFFWEARGIRSGFKLTDSGYITEIAIPASVLGWDSITPGKTMGANLRVVDMDSGIDPDEADRGFIWAPDPEHTAHICTKSYNRIVFSEPAMSAENSYQQTQTAQTQEGVNVVLGSPDLIEGEEIITNVLAEIAEDDYTSAELILNQSNDQVWVKPLLGVLQEDSGDFDAAINTYLEYENECTDSWLKKWAKLYAVIAMQKKINVYVDAGDKDNALIMLNKILALNPDESKMLEVAYVLEALKEHEKVVEICDYVYNNTTDPDYKSDAQLRLARNCFYIGEYNRATELSESLIANDRDSKKLLDARMILLSVENATKQ